MSSGVAAQPASAPVPPQSLEAEESVLGALMLMPYDSPITDLIRDTGLTPRDFYRESHATIYKAALALQAERIDADAIALTDRLEENGTLDTVGGRARIHELASLVPATSNAPHYAGIVHEMSMLRGLIATGQRIARLGWERPGKTSDLLEEARSLVDDTANGSGPAVAVKVVTLDEFTSVTDDTAEPLIGTPDDTLLPAQGMLLMYGDGGAGKTTLSVDALAHLASGTDWLGITIPRPVTTVLIENEGPRGPFRKLLAHKRAHWQGNPFTPNVHVLEEPWTRFTLTEPAYRRGLGKEIDRTQADLVIVGPLASLGAKGTGTPDDINEFSALISDLRARATRPFALWIVHHENKAGDVSGAWERVPDTLVHVSAQGNGRTRVYWRKVRWSSALHNTSLQLLWGDNSGFTIDEARARDYRAELLEAFDKDDRWRTYKEASGLIAANPDRVRETLTELVDAGEMTFQIGPPGRSPLAKCWKLRRPETDPPNLFTTDSDSPSQSESQGANGVPVDRTDSLTPPIRESEESGQYTSTNRTDSDSTSQNTPNDNRGRWFDE